MDERHAFTSTKAVIFIGSRVLVYLRDDKPGLRFAHHWDLPGGGKEEDETPYECLRRETQEEFGIDVPRGAIIYGTSQPSHSRPELHSWFFVAKLPAAIEGAIAFGDEGQYWELWSTDRILACDTFVPFLKDQLRSYLEARGIFTA